MRVREIGWPSGFLTLVIAIYCLLAALYAVLVPPWESPDEPAHYRYVMQLAERWRPPMDPMVRQRASFCRDYAFTTSNYEWYHPALGYLPLAVAYKVLSFLIPDSLPVDFPPFNPLFCSDPFRNPNLFHQAHRLPDIWRGQGGLAILRFLSSLWGTVIVYTTYKIGQWMKMEGFEIVAASWVAFLPQFTFISATVRNDTVTNALSAILLILIIRMQISAERHNWLAAATGFALGAGILAKLTTVYLIPVALAAVALSAKLFAKKWPGLVIGFFLPLLILVGGYYLVYPEARSALSYMNAHLSVKPQAFSWAYWKPFFPMLIELFFARFGWANIRVPAWWIVCAAGIWALGFGASAFCGVDLLRRRDKIDQKQFLARVLLLLFLGLLLAFVGVLRYNLAVFQPQGRFLFPAIVSWALLGTWGFSFVLPKRTKAMVGFGMILFMLAFNIRSLIALVQTYY